MGKVMALYRIYPEENYDLDKIVDELKKIERVKAIQKEPVAFGLVVLKVGVIYDDKTDKPAEFEEYMENIEGIKQVESIDVTLIS
jgi:translation elongation factor aEF-1 beta